MQSNTLAHQRHTEEIALGLALGPHSENYKYVNSKVEGLASYTLILTCRSVSEKTSRPLSRLRPGSAVVESVAYKNMADQITRYEKEDTPPHYVTIVKPPTSGSGFQYTSGGIGL